jgi:hypothetical protein
MSILMGFGVCMGREIVVDFDVLLRFQKKLLGLSELNAYTMFIP